MTSSGLRNSSLQDDNGPSFPSPEIFSYHEMCLYFKKLARLRAFTIAKDFHYLAMNWKCLHKWCLNDTTLSARLLSSKEVTDNVSSHAPSNHRGILHTGSKIEEMLTTGEWINSADIVRLAGIAVQKQLSFFLREPQYSRAKSRIE